MADNDPNLPDTGWTNPFLRNIPMVAIVRQKVVRNGEVMYSDDTRSKRVFFRVPNNRAIPPQNSTDANGNPGEIMPSAITGVGGGAIDSLYGFDRLLPFYLGRKPGDPT